MWIDLSFYLIRGRLVMGQLYIMHLECSLLILPWNLYNNRWFSSLLETDSSEGEQTAFLTPHLSFHHRRFSVVISPTLEHYYEVTSYLVLNSLIA